VLIESFPAGPWATNCYIVANEANSECIIIDPGFDSLAEIEQTCQRFNLHPVATLLTHGHMDHVWSVVPLCESHNISAYLHSADEWMLNDPEKAYSAGGWQEITKLAGGTPDFLPINLEIIKNHSILDLAGIKIKNHHAPGHTEGSTVFESGKHLFSGDVLFNRGIGRTDLAGGSSSAMERSLKNVILKFPDDMNVYPGHGPGTTIKDERTKNPYLQHLT
jgi:glyoxylase-like metal-dependent hydrolase (beta-lactamase superfamily II)